LKETKIYKFRAEEESEDELPTQLISSDGEKWILQHVSRGLLSHKKMTGSCILDAKKWMY